MPAVAVGLLLWVAAEIAAIVVLVHLIGGLATFLLIVAGSFAGSALLRMQGRRVWAALRAAGPTALDTALGRSIPMLAAGVLLAIPTPLTDLAALIVLAPVTRPLLGRLFTGMLERRLVAAQQAYGFDVDPAPQPEDPHGDVIQGHVVGDSGEGSETGRPR